MRFLLLVHFVLIPIYQFALHGQEVLDSLTTEISRKACDCLEDTDPRQPTEKLSKQVDACLLQAVLDYADELEQRAGIDFNDPAASELISQQINQKLFKKCDVYSSFMVLTGERIKLIDD